MNDSHHGNVLRWVSGQPVSPVRGAEPQRHPPRNGRSERAFGLHSRTSSASFKTIEGNPRQTPLARTASGPREIQACTAKDANSPRQ